MTELLAKYKFEKRELQKKLHRFQNEFFAKNGRKVKYRSDRAPMEKEYERYRFLRHKLEELSTLEKLDRQGGGNVENIGAGKSNNLYRPEQIYGNRSGFEDEGEDEENDNEEEEEEEEEE